MMSSISVIIATSQRPHLLQRTLQSLYKCNFPRNFQELVVVENGEKMGIEDLLKPYSENMPIRYLHAPEANKSHALNTALEEGSADLAVFLDDDVRIHKDTLLAYSQSARKMNLERFFGGPVYIDYEKQPPEWLLGKLPASARGWSLGNRDKLISDACFLGTNWAAFISEVKNVGGFDETMGPGSASGSDGEETNMQRRLLQSGKLGKYLAKAKVWHYVPKNRCTVEWTISKAKKLGVAAGMENRRNQRLEKNVRFIRAAFVYTISSAVVEILKKKKSEKKMGLRWPIRKSYYHAFLSAK